MKKKKYIVAFVEQVIHRVPVEASDEDEAEEIARDVLNSTDFEEERGIEEVHVFDAKEQQRKYTKWHKRKPVSKKG